MTQEITPFVTMMKQVGAQQGFNIPQPTMYDIFVFLIVMYIPPITFTFYF